MCKKSNYYTLFVSQASVFRAYLKIGLLIFFLQIVLPAFPQEDFSNLPPKFQNLSLNDGLSNLAIHTICQDNLGYVWIGTARGLNRYDGISFKHYYYKNDGASLNHDDITDLHKMPNGNILCSTIAGLNVFNIAKEKFVSVKSRTIRYNSFVNYDSLLYAANSAGGIYNYNPEFLEMTTVENFPTNINVDNLVADTETGIWGRSVNNQFIINYNPVSSVYEKYFLPNSDTMRTGGTMDKVGKQLIISTNSNITVFNIEKRLFENNPEKFSVLTSIQDKTINFICEVEKDILWIGTKGNGLYVYNTLKQTLTNFTKAADRHTLKSNHLTCYYKDDVDNIWIGTFDRGVEISFKRRKNFNFDLNLHDFTKDKFITSICTDYKGMYYIGTRLSGLYIYNARTNETSILNKENSFIADNHIRSLFLSSTNDLWISSEKQLNVWNLTNKKHKIIELPQPNNGLVCFCESEENIFAGSDQQGLLKFSIDGSLQDTIIEIGLNITQILKLKDSKLLVAAYGHGIFEYDFKTKVSQNLNEIISPRLENLNEIITCSFDSKENLWIGNFKYGLYKISKDKNEVVTYDMQSGLPSNDITGIVEDNSGNLWISTAYGLSMLSDNNFTNYSYNEGLENVQFHQKAVLKDEFGTLFFGGNFGLTFLNPRVLGLEKTKAPKVVLEKLKVSNREVRPDDDTKILDKNLALTSRIKLTHHYPNFSIEFKGFDYVAAKELEYAYILEGFNSDWNYVDNRNFASYANLKSGTYVFKVKVKNNSGTWSEEPAMLTIEIKPAPWLTIWAMFAYFLIVSFFTWGSFKLVLRAKLFKKELEFEHNERVRENEISKMKLRFFTNISHEIRTPLTLIKGNVDYLMSELKEKEVTLNSTNSLKNSTDRLLRLVNQLLSFRQLENDALDLKIKNNDIIKITKELIESFKFTSKLKGISLDIQSKNEKLVMPIDQDKYEKILNNLITNSLKFCKKNGFIKIVLETQSSELLSTEFKVDPEIEEYVKISVIDNGKGISSDKLPFVFDRFVQYNNQKSKPDYSGTGIGLNFTKRLIDLHNGSIIAKSKEKEETCFSFILPANERIYSPETWGKTEGIDSFEYDENETIEELPTNEAKKTILLVEDDIELNKFIQNALSGLFKVICTFDGKVALKLAKNQLPDIIISDIMMPEMDGITLCKRIREDDLISHIPVILLTAKSEVENKIIGYKFGADEYITKPFELNVLKIRIQNLIKQRSALQEYYKKAMPVEFKAEIANQFEINFMKNINNVVAENYKSSEFNVHLLAENMNMSRTSFYRKFMSITDISPKDYITNYRINKSIELIKTGYDSFGEISFLCGFSSQSIFSIAFKKAKGVTPLQFKRSLKK
jgi:signal transduction histidine kinase/DNA-binding response OmpR family regulator/ligand-binding sensor domain-containing protein